MSSGGVFIPPLLRARFERLSGGTTATSFVRVSGLGHVIIKVINLHNATSLGLGNCAVCPKGSLDGTEFLSLMHGLEFAAIGKDISWQGKIEITPEQELFCVFESSKDVAAALNDHIIVVVGYHKA